MRGCGGYILVHMILKAGLLNMARACSAKKQPITSLK
jgi:hypothetical protein